jgi:NAD(P)H-dependent FMN reductase
MSDIPIVEIGAGGALAAIILREVFSFLKAQKSNKNNGPYLSRAEFQTHKESVQYKDNCEQIVKRVDAAFEAQEKMFRLMEKRIEDHFRDVKKLIRNGGR